MASIFKRPNGVFYVQFYKGGKRVQRSLGTKNQQVARRLCRRLEQEVARQGQSPKGALTWEELEARYLDWCEVHCRPRTVHLKRRTLRDWHKTITVSHPAGVSQADVEVYKERRSSEASPTTINIMLRNMKAMYSWATKHGLLDHNPFKGVSMLKAHRRLPKTLSVAEKEAVLAAAARLGPSEHLFCALGLLAGLRLAEIMAAQWTWVDFDQGRISVLSSDNFTVKDHEERSFAAKTALLEVLEIYRPASGKGSEYIVQPYKQPSSKEGKDWYRYSPRSLVARVVEESGVQFSTQMLRATFASHAVQAGVSIYKVSRWLGHSSVQVTERHYAHLIPDDQDMERF